ncbi:hypothetical protein [Citrobacter portucalensis]|uniref:hypothetical protein n=1 Tax=Citrobacter portucalensis TaxID=1639133 RepID=UPI002433612B|nr:hypothetical protein [Citrobacter portucalensis]WFZ31470.1 hypothetical protein NFK62_11930 [Citrobacter portucalensis]WFZ36471.1 hypothetical protein NFK63_11920 [Citrobacter portucalensis]
MSKIARYQGNVRAFASDAQGMERTVFGGTNQADDLTSQITASFLRGWGIVGASEHPSLEDFNAAMYAMSQFIAYQHQMGVPEWHAEQEYHIGSICTHNGESYQSLQNANIGSQPPSAKWTPVLTSKNGLANLGLEDLAKTSANNTFTGEVKFTLSVSLPANTAYKGIGLQAWFDYKQDKDDTLTALSGKDVAGLLSYLGLTSAAKTDAKNTFTQKQTFSGSVALPSDTTLNGTGLEYLFDSKLDASKALGTGQTWVNVTASRTAGVTYTNSTTRPICVSIPETGDGDRGLYVGGVLTAFARGADSDSTLFAIVPPGAQYIFSGAFSSWAELR